MRRVALLSLLVMSGCSGDAEPVRVPEEAPRAVASASAVPSGSASAEAIASGGPAVSASAARKTPARIGPPKFPPRDAEFALVQIPPTDGAGEVCVVVREIVRAPNASVEMIYGKNGKRTRWESWHFPWTEGAKPEMLDWEDNQYTGDRLVRLKSKDDTLFTYDSNGLLASSEHLADHGGGMWTKNEYVWTGKRIKLSATFIAPPLYAGTTPLPMRLPFTGEVTWSQVQGKRISTHAKQTVEYDKNGWARPKGWKHGANGEPLGPASMEWKWDGNKLVERTDRGGKIGEAKFPATRETYEYDNFGRLVRLRHFSKREGQSEELDWERRYEHRCTGSFLGAPGFE